MSHSYVKGAGREAELKWDNVKTTTGVVLVFQQVPLAINDGAMKPLYDEVDDEVVDELPALKIGRSRRGDFFTC